MEQTRKKVREEVLRYLLVLVSGVSLLFTNTASADCVKPVYSGENLWKLVARIGDCFDDSFTQINSVIDTITCSNPVCEVTIRQEDIPYVITQPGIYCLAESVQNTGINDFLITVSASNVILDLTQHVMYGGNQDGYEQGAQDGIQVWPGVQNVVIKNGTLTGFAQYAINASTGLQPNIQTPIQCLTIEDIKVVDIVAYLPGQSNIDFYADQIGSTLDSLSAVAGFDPVLECCLGNSFSRIKTPAGIFVDGANSVIVRGCSVLNAEGDGIYLRYVQEGLVQNTQSDGNGGNGFVFDNCDVTTVQSCGAEQNGLNGFYEVSCNGDNSYKDSNAKQNGVHGFRVIGSGKTIERCAANQNTLHGFYLVTPQSGTSSADGTLDITFNGDGKVTTAIGAFDSAFALAVQKDGKIVAVGDTDGFDLFALARYNYDGSLDTNFNGTGTVTTDFGGTNQSANAVAIQDDGKIVAAGFSNAGGTVKFALARYNSDGSLDSGFGVGGLVLTSVGGSDTANAVLIQQDGKIVAVGSSNAGSDFALARYNSDGSLDAGFGVGGLVTTDLSGDSDTAYGAALQADGKIIAVGNATVGGFRDFAAARYNTDGSLDTSFNGTGIVTTNLGKVDDQAKAVAIQKDGKIVLAGFSAGGGTTDFALVRYNIDGSLDNNFNGTGIVLTPVAGGASATRVVIQKDGRIVASGSFGANFSLGIIRYHTNGLVDTSFGTSGNGMVTTNFSPGVPMFGFGGALQEDGKLLVVGYDNAFSSRVFAVARYNIFKRPCLIQDCIALENGRDGFNIVDAAQATLLRNVASNNGCNGFIAPTPFVSALDIVAKNLADNNQCANYSNIDSALLDVAVLPWGNVRGN